MMKKLLLTVAVCSVMMAPAHAHDGEHATLIHAGQMLNTDTGRLMSNQYILVEEGLIQPSVLKLKSRRWTPQKMPNSSISPITQFYQAYQTAMCT